MIASIRSVLKHKKAECNKQLFKSEGLPDEWGVVDVKHLLDPLS